MAVANDFETLVGTELIVEELCAAAGLGVFRADCAAAWLRPEEAACAELAEPAPECPVSPGAAAATAQSQPIATKNPTPTPNASVPT